MGVVYRYADLALEKQGNYLFQFMQNRKLTAVYHGHDFYEVVYFLRGHAVQRINDESVVTEADNFLVLRPGDYHCFTSQSEDVKLISLSVTKEEFELFANTYDPRLLKRICTGAPILCTATDGEFLHTLFAGLPHSVTKYDCKFFLSCFLKLYISITKCLQQKSDLPPGFAYAAQEMKKTENLKRGIPAFVELSNYSQSHLARLVKQHFDMSLKQYINELRLQNAYGSIILTSEAVDRISEGLGFASFSHFNKIFKKRFSVTPAVLRKTGGIWTA